MKLSQLQQTDRRQRRSTLYLRCALAAPLLLACLSSTAQAQAGSSQVAPSASSQLTLEQLEIERERLRLRSSAAEERRDALMRLGAMKRADSARAAAAGLGDSAAIVRVTAVRAILSLPADEAAALLIPLLRDRDEFVRQETAYALGETGSPSGVAPLVAVLQKDKQSGPRGAAAVALGQIRDESALIPLTGALSRRLAASGLLNRIRRAKTEENEFVRRAAARSLGQIGSRAAVPVLIAVVLDERAPDDVRRESARSLGSIADPSAVQALRSLLTARDPYLSRIAYEALLRIAPAEAARPSTPGR
ncbi:MAG TPA: HEAT repeat domain-containing protein [Pyrinomonadaceae bacterium]|jgi:HEAT repeat protein